MGLSETLSLILWVKRDAFITTMTEADATKPEYSNLARQFGLGRETIRNAVDGLTFKYLPMSLRRQR